MGFFISDAFAATASSAATTAQPSGGMGSLIMVAVFVALIYLMVWLPQSRRMKAQQQLINSLSKDDEVVTSGGIVGKINKLDDNFVGLTIADDVDVTIQKASVVATLPKGTLKSIH